MLKCQHFVLYLTIISILYSFLTHEYATPKNDEFESYPNKKKIWHKFIPLQIESDEALRPAHQHDPAQFFLSVKQIRDSISIVQN